jgi:hypothetical protein
VTHDPNDKDHLHEEIYGALALVQVLMQYCGDYMLKNPQICPNVPLLAAQMLVAGMMQKVGALSSKPDAFVSVGDSGVTNEEIDNIFKTFLMDEEQKGEG